MAVGIGPTSEAGVVEAVAKSEGLMGRVHAVAEGMGLGKAAEAAKVAFNAAKEVGDQGVVDTARAAVIAVRHGLTEMASGVVSSDINVDVDGLWSDLLDKVGDVDVGVPMVLGFVGGSFLGGLIGLSRKENVIAWAAAGSVVGAAAAPLVAEYAGKPVMNQVYSKAFN